MNDSGLSVLIITLVIFAFIWMATDEKNDIDYSVFKLVDSTCKDNGGVNEYSPIKISANHLSNWNYYSWTCINGATFQASHVQINDTPTLKPYDKDYKAHLELVVINKE